MYARINLNSGCTLQQLRDDIVGLLTGTITSAAGLTSANTGTSEVVNTLAAEWTFVQHLAGTSSRCHFVLSGVDDGGVAKTLGIVLTNTSGTLGFFSWSCGSWDSANKRPAAINVTGWTLATAWMTASDFDAGGNKNGIITHSNSLTPTSVGVFNTGLMQFQITSEQGLTSIHSHYSANHLTLLDWFDLPRSYWSAWDVTEWPFLLVNISAPGQGVALLSNSISSPHLSSISATTNQVGLAYGPNAWATLSSPLSTEITGTTRFWNGNISPVGSFYPNDLDRETVNNDVIGWCPDKNGTQKYIPHASVLIPGNAAFYVNPIRFLPIPHRIPGRMIPIGSTASVVVAYLDEFVAGADTYVGIGNAQPCVYKG